MENETTMKNLRNHFFLVGAVGRLDPLPKRA